MMIVWQLEYRWDGYFRLRCNQPFPGQPIGLGPPPSASESELPPPPPPVCGLLPALPRPPHPANLVGIGQSGGCGALAL